MNFSLMGAKKVAIAWLAVLACVTTAPARAQADLPSKPVHWIVPFAPGGLTDIVVRVVARGLQNELGQNVVVENRAGAGGAAGTAAALRAPPDGSTVFAVSSSNTTLAKLIPKGATFDWEKDMTLLANLAASPNILAARPGLPANDLTTVVGLGKTAGGLTYASSGLGTPGHLNCELLKLKLGINLTHVPYQGGAPALTDVAADRVDLLCTDFVTARGFLNDNRIKPVVSLNTRRARQLPDVRSVSEERIAEPRDFDSSALWIGVATSSATPPAIVERLQQALEATLRRPETRAALEATGASVSAEAGEAFRRMVAQEQSTFQRVITSEKLRF